MRQQTKKVETLKVSKNPRFNFSCETNKNQMESITIDTLDDDRISDSSEEYSEDQPTRVYRKRKSSDVVVSKKSKKSKEEGEARGGSTIPGIHVRKKIDDAYDNQEIPDVAEMMSLRIRMQEMESAQLKIQAERDGLYAKLNAISHKNANSIPSSPNHVSTPPSLFPASAILGTQRVESHGFQENAYISTLRALRMLKCTPEDHFEIWEENTRLYLEKQCPNLSTDDKKDAVLHNLDVIPRKALQGLTILSVNDIFDALRPTYGQDGFAL